MEKKYLGYIRYFDDDRKIYYSNKEKFLKDIKKTLYCYGTNGWAYYVFDKEVNKEIYKIISDDFGIDD